MVAAAFGMNPEGVLIYLADRVDEPRLAEALSAPGPGKMTPTLLP
jgi:hypothetical protein